MNRAEHLAWCKERAMEYVIVGDLTNAYGSFVSDMGKHPETADHIGLQLGVALMVNGHLSTRKQMEDFIEGFN